MRQELFAYAESRKWLVVGDSFDNSKPCLDANGFRQLRDAAQQGRVDNILAVSYTHLDVYKRQEMRGLNYEYLCIYLTQRIQALRRKKGVRLAGEMCIRDSLSVAEPMKLSVGSFHLTIPNGTDPQLLAQTLRIEMCIRDRFKKVQNHNSRMMKITIQEM